MLNSFQVLLSNSTCAATPWATPDWPDLWAVRDGYCPEIWRVVNGKVKDYAKVGRCRLTVSKPALKAPVPSALESILS
jgi:hypothetical protein